MSEETPKQEVPQPEGEGDKAAEQPPQESQQQEATEGGDKPTEGGEKPAAEGEQPAEGGEKPAEGEQPAPEQQEEEEEEEEEEEPDDGVPIVLVTGASGFIATHIIHQLLQQGRFHVRGTVRDRKREDKVKPLRELVPDAKYPLRLVKAELQKPESWKKAVDRCAYVFHVASPFPFKSPRDENEVIAPAVEGTKNVLQACVNAGTVKRVILTSSVAAVSTGVRGNPGKPADYVYTEEDWSDESSCPTYDKSKLKAEQAAWEFVKGLEEDKQFELTVLNPSYVQGPLFSQVSGGSSADVCQRLLANKVAGCPNVSFGVVDVRDVAAAHIAAMEKPEAAGNRYILVNSTQWFREIAAIINEEFRPQGYKVPTKNIPKAGMWVAKFFDSGAKMVYANLGKYITYSNEKMKRELGIEPRPVRESIVDMCYSLVELGLVKKTRGYLGHPSTRPPPPPPEEPKTEGEGEQTTEAAAKDEPPKEEPPKDEAPKEEAPKNEAPKEAPKEEPVKEEPPAEEPPKEEPPKEDEPAKEEPPTEEPAKEEPAREEPPAEEPAKEEEPAREEPPAEEPAKEDEPPKEESPAEEPAKEEPPAKEAPPQEQPAEPEQTSEQPKESSEPPQAEGEGEQ